MGRAPLVILVVEDNADFADVLSLSLRNEGHEVHVVTSGADAIDRARNKLFDAVLLDLNLGDMNGFDVARQLRRGPLPASSIIVILTAAQASHEEPAVDLLLGKPVNFELMDGLLRQLLSLRERRPR